MIRLFEPSPEILEALRGSGILVSLGIKNQDLATLSSSQDEANAWVQTNVVPYKDDVKFVWISAGNDVIPGPLAQNVPGAMNNIYNALVANGLGQIQVTTVVSGTALGTSFPPSAGAFSPEVIDIMTQVTAFLKLHKTPLMVDVYPYFAYADDPAHISSDYALFKSTSPVVVDENLNYYNLFDAMVDAFNAALEKIDMSDVLVAVSGSGWPTAGNDPYASIENAQTYNTNLINHVRNTGTPRRPDQPYYLFLFSMFNEDLKQPAGVEQHFGLFYPSMEPVYPLSFN
ncbi:Glycoside hydrolase [Macleaya cordata]|uniref:Glycoside hydrolase n=1 Tax=Macleaya cordata TaxID=56857 RepID=A0A200QEA4_MACCD|nr:Glycoside hydrolase [Macleaya cordata]